LCDNAVYQINRIITVNAEETLQQRRSKAKEVTKFESQMLPEEERGNTGKSKSVEPEA
jgi:hypothetical protein